MLKMSVFIQYSLTNDIATHKCNLESYGFPTGLKTIFSNKYE